MITEPIRFAHRGAPARPAESNTLAAFSAALRAGAEGLESDVRLTADGQPVLVHRLDLLRGRLRRGQPIGRLRRSELPDSIPSLADLWERCGSDFLLALDMVDPAAAAAVVDLARRYDAVSRLWLTYWRLPEMAVWRRRWPEIKLLYATMLGVPGLALRRTVRRAAAAGVDAVNLHHRIVRPQTAAVAHAAGLKLFAWGLRGTADARRVAALGADAVFVDHLSG